MINSTSNISYISVLKNLMIFLKPGKVANASSPPPPPPVGAGFETNDRVALEPQARHNGGPTTGLLYFFTVTTHSLNAIQIASSDATHYTRILETFSDLLQPCYPVTGHVEDPTLTRQSAHKWR
jgi:hypothetical protein